MAWATIKEVKGLVSTTMTNSTVQTILDLAQEEIEEMAGTSTYSVTLKMAVIYKTCANMLRQMKSSGELAYTNKIGVTHQINEIDEMIKYYDVQAESYIVKYRMANVVAGSDAPYIIAPCNYRDAEE
jgi:hypothetical protein